LVRCSRFALVVTLLFSGLMFSLLGCGITLFGAPPGAVVGRWDVYDYSPSVIQSGDELQFWWCGGGHNPNKHSQGTDVILYESINTTTHQTDGPLIVMGETPGSWDHAYTCNPRVVRGSFNNPIGDGQTYTYAMYYVGTAEISGVDNSIGVAFSNDGILWKKYNQPVIQSTSQTGYGVAQPAAYNQDQKSGITLFYEDATASSHVKATSSDGVHFTRQGTLTTNGMDPNNPQPSWGDLGYDPSTGYWYATFNLPDRPPDTTGGMVETGQYGIELYRIPDASLLSGASPWTLLKIIDTNLTGHESNFLAGLLHDMYGNINVGPYPSIQVYPSISNPPPTWNASPQAAGDSGKPSRWDIGSFVWTPNQPSMALNRYSNKTSYDVTTGWIDPSADFLLDSTLGHLYATPQNGATVAFYGCKRGSTDYFVSLDLGCEGQRILGINGYGYAQPTANLTLVALYRCTTGAAHFVSKDPNCEGDGAGMLLGYALP
jgi:hypothetical protein